jgi:outer membrane protein OmpA-like peptidoglycan-associated protein/tetratricopeptide (TPR) repeat protein
MKRYILIFTACLLFAEIVSAQPLYKAQRRMDKYNYAEAVEILKKAVNVEKTRNAALPMLAECYRLQHDVVNSCSTYAEVVALPDAKPEWYYYYAQALQSTGDYTRACEIFGKYAEMNPSDSAGHLFIAQCDSVLGPWKNKTPEFEVKQVNKINTDQSDFGPAFRNGELVFASDYSYNPAESKKYGWTGRGFLNIMKSRSATAGDFWGSMEASSEFDSRFNQEYHDGPAAFSADGNTIYYTRSFYGKAKREGIFKTNLLKIYYSSKNDSTWSEPKPFFLNSIEYSIGHPSLSADSKTLYFASDMPGGSGKTDIWMCKRQGDSWSQAENLGPTVNTHEKEMFPTIYNDSILYFASEGHPGYGALDIFKTTKIQGIWTTPVNLHPPLNGPGDDFAIAFAAGQKNGFFSSNRQGGLGSDDIYAFRNIEPPVLPAYLSGLVKDKTTMQPIAGATVFLYNPKTSQVKILKTGVDGIYKTLVVNPADFVVKAMMPEYIADCLPFTIAVLNPGSTTLAPRDLLLDKLVISKTFRIENIYYDFDKYNIRADAKPELDKLVRIMNENDIKVELGSHTDCRGSFAYNDKLSQNRAESAVKYITGEGIDKSRITAKGYGEHQLTNKCSDGIHCTSPEHQANRRTEVKVISLTKTDPKAQQFNLEQYSDGQEFKSELLPPDFFIKCN